MSDHKRRLDRLAEQIRGQCERGCAKCALAKIWEATGNGESWGCNGRPVGLLTVIRLADEAPM